MKKLLILGVSILLFFSATPAIAASVTAAGGATLCNQTVGVATNVSAYQTANGDCVVEFRNVGSTTWTVPTGVTSITYLVVAGGGGGAGGQASEHGGGGGGAGGVLSGTLSVSPGNISVAVGGGGAGGAGGSSSAGGSSGSNSALAGSVTANGGGGGGSYFNAGPATGGSGGGAGNTATTAYLTGANGTAGQGNKGGNVTSSSTNGRHAAGGGGAGAAGGNTVTSGSVTITAGAGGDGVTSSITGSTLTYGGGGGGGGSSAAGGGATGGGAGGAGGGGAGASYNGTSAIAATSGGANTGGGGGGGIGTGGANGNNGGAGGSGIIIIRYVLAPSNASIPVISGSAAYGQSLSTTDGTWSYSPASYAYQWSRSATVGGTYTNISGATSATYTTVAADVGQYLKVTVTATNTSGSAASTSSATGQISRGSTSVSLTIAAGNFIYRSSKQLTATSTIQGKATFRANRESIPGCKNLTLNSSNSFTRVCNYKPSIHGLVVITLIFTPTDSNIDGSPFVSAAYPVRTRTGTR